MNNIVFCLDNNYASLLGVAMASLLKNSRSSYTLFIMHKDLTSENQLKIQKIADKYHADIHFLAVDEDKELSEFKKPTIWANKVCYYRLLAPVKISRYANNISLIVQNYCLLMRTFWFCATLLLCLIFR